MACSLIKVMPILFCSSFALDGALAETFKVGGGITGFANRVKPFVKSEKVALLSVWAATPISVISLLIIFVDLSILN